MAQDSSDGSVLALILYDVCEEIKLDNLRAIMGAGSAQPRLKHAAAEQVSFERPPVVEVLDPLLLNGGERLNAEMKYYDYGVVGIVFELPFSGKWNDLVQLASRWMSGSEFEQHAFRIVGEKLKRAHPALVKPYSKWLSEDYFIFNVRKMQGSPSAAELIAGHGIEIAQIVRGETLALSDGERNEVMQSRLSYYRTDLAVIGWNAAFLYDTDADTDAGAETAIQLLEYANSQLLEFRHYDELLTRELATVYDALGKKTGTWHRWRVARAAARLQTVLLEVTELTERADNAIKFLSDMFSARLYRLASTKVGVPDYKDLVSEKLRTAEELYQFMVNQFNQSRAFVLELMVVIILVIELVYVFYAKIG